MRWERFFDDIEDQLDAQWEAEREALAAESERLRIARLSLRHRLAALADEQAVVGVRVRGLDAAVSGVVVLVGADWMGINDETSRLVLVPLASVADVSVHHADLLASARSRDPGPALRERVTFAFVARDLARKRVVTELVLDSVRAHAGTIDRVGADHLDIAVHDRGAPRRASEVRTHVLVPLDAIAAISIEHGTALAAV